MNKQNSDKPALPLKSGDDRSHNQKRADERIVNLVKQLARLAAEKDFSHEKT